MSAPIAFQYERRYCCGMRNQPISRAIATLGSQSALASGLGVTQGLISQWSTGRLKVPAERCIAIEQATNGAVTRYELRPDVFGQPANREVNPCR